MKPLFFVVLLLGSQAVFGQQDWDIQFNISFYADQPQIPVLKLDLGHGLLTYEDTIGYWVETDDRVIVREWIMAESRQPDYVLDFSENSLSLPMTARDIRALQTGAMTMLYLNNKQYLLTREEQAMVRKLAREYFPSESTTGTRALTFLTGYIEAKDDHFVVVIDSDYPMLKQGDEIAYMIEGMDFESKYTYQAGQTLDFNQEREAMHLYQEFYPLVKQHGLTYVRINDYKHVFTDSERQQIANQAKRLLK